MLSGSLFGPSALNKISVNVPSSAPAFIPFPRRSSALYRVSANSWLLPPPRALSSSGMPPDLHHSTFFVFFFSFFNSSNNHRKLFTGLPLGPCEFSTLYRGFWEASWGWGDHIPGSFFSPVAHAVPPNLISTPVGLICPRCTTSFSVHYASPVPGGLGRF